MSERSDSTLASIWAVALITAGLTAAVVPSLPSWIRLVGGIASFLGLVLLVGVTIRPLREVALDRWGWRGWGWQGGHLPERKVPVPDVMLWLGRSDGRWEDIQLTCRVIYPDLRPVMADSQSIQRTGPAGSSHYVCFFPKGFLGGAAPPIPDGVYQVEWFSESGVGRRPLKRLKFSVRSGSLVGGSEPRPIIRSVSEGQPPTGFSNYAGSDDL